LYLGNSEVPMGQLPTLEIMSGSPIDLMLESNHRVANSLAVLAATLHQQIVRIGAGADTVPRKQVVEILNETAGKIVAISRLHRCFADNADREDCELHDVLTKVLQELERSGIYADRLRIGSIETAHHLHVEPTQAFRLTLAVAEMVTNAMKHAHPTGLPVEISLSSVSAADGATVLEISDDGVGFPEGFVEARDAGVGLKLIRSLVEGAGATLEVRSDPLGLVYAIRISPG
jgi:two-component sensor histidine kinase